MTTNELRKKFNTEFEGRNWPMTYEVDSATYGNVCQSIFDFYKCQSHDDTLHIKVGPNNGILFKNIELILIETKERNE